MKRTILAAGAALALATVASASPPARPPPTPAPAAGAQPNHPKPQASTTRRPTSSRRHHLNAGSSVEALCFIPDGEKVDSNAVWFRVAVDGRTGWVPKAVIGGVPSNLPGC